MKAKRILVLEFVTVLFTLFLFCLAFSQGKGEKTISFSGTIDHVPRGSNYIVVNERRVYLSENTKVATEKGSLLNRGDLKRGFIVVVEGVEKPEGIVAQRITVLPKRKT